MTDALGCVHSTCESSESCHSEMLDAFDCMQIDAPCDGKILLCVRSVCTLRFFGRTQTRHRNPDRCVGVCHSHYHTSHWCSGAGSLLEVQDQSHQGKVDGNTHTLKILEDLVYCTHRNANTQNNNVMCTAMAAQQDPLYSVLDSGVSVGPTQPPQLPPDRVPYYQEIESDGTGGAAKAHYEVPLSSPPPSGQKYIRCSGQTLPHSGQTLHATLRSEIYQTLRSDTATLRSATH